MYRSFLSLTVENTNPRFVFFLVVFLVFLVTSHAGVGPPYETVTNAMKSAQNLSPGRFRHAEAESEVKNLQNFHPDLEIKENDLQNIFD